MEFKKYKGRDHIWKWLLGHGTIVESHMTQRHETMKMKTCSCKENLGMGKPSSIVEKSLAKDPTLFSFSFPIKPCEDSSETEYE